MIHRLFTAASAISLLLAVTMAIAWPAIGAGHRSLWRSHALDKSYVEVSIYRNQLRFRSRQRMETAARPTSKRLLPAWLGRLGISAGDAPGDYVMVARIEGQSPTYSYQRVRTLSLHLALLLGAAGLLPAAWLLSRRPRAVGNCTSCGYDLRASTGRCPECGTRIPLAIGSAEA